MDLLEGQTWVIDTSSLINVKELVKIEFRQGIFSKLEIACNEGKLVYPIEVIAELKNGVKQGESDPPLTWAKKNKKLGCRLGRCFDELSEVMNHPVAKLTPDANQSVGEDDADPHVLATALKIVSLGGNPIVVTQESRKRHPQVPLNIAAGALGLPSINLYALLIAINAWSDDMKVL